MKIAFIGAHATGKTTLAYEIATSLKKRNFNVDVLGEVSRDCPFPINENTTIKAQSWILFTQYLKEIEKEDKCDYLVCDRSVLDNYAYYVRKFGRSEEMEPFILNHMKSYGYLFKVPIREEYLTKDGIRSIDKKFQKEIDENVDELLLRFKVNFNNYTTFDEAMEVITKRK
jgi:nicotinamide riboside kinase